MIDTKSILNTRIKSTLKAKDRLNKSVNRLNVALKPLLRLNVRGDYPLLQRFFPLKNTPANLSTPAPLEKIGDTTSAAHPQKRRFDKALQPIVKRVKYLFHTLYKSVSGPIAGKTLINNLLTSLNLFLDSSKFLFRVV